jgi:hypothetical protein
MKKEELYTKLSRHILVLFPLISLLVIACMGIYSRYMSDDYNTAYNLATRGYWGMQTYYWAKWTGRYSFIATLGLIESFGPNIVPFLPGFIIFLLYSTIGWTTLQLLKSTGVEKPIFTSLSLAGLITWVSIRSLFLYPEILFWQTGIINYTVSPVLFALIVGLLIKRLGNDAPTYWGEIFFWLVLTIFCGGFSEGAVAIQITFLGVAFFVIAIRPFQNKRNMLVLVGLGLAGSLLSLALMVTAPGNLARALNSDESMRMVIAQDNISNVGGLILNSNLGARLADVFTYSCSLILDWITDRTVFACLAFLGGVFIGMFYDFQGMRFDIKSAINSFFLAGFFVYLEMWVAVAPSFLARGFAPPERARLLPIFFLVSLAVYYGWLFARVILALSLGKPLIWIRTGIAFFTILFLFLGPGATLISNIRLIPVLKSYADIWDDRDQFIRQSVVNGDHIVVVENINKAKELSELQANLIWKVGDFNEDPGYWVNEIAAQYYGVDQIIAE